MTESPVVAESFDTSRRHLAAQAAAGRLWGPSPVIAVALLGAALVAGGVAGFHRIGTTANAEQVTTFERLAGGFAAVGRTETQPGFVLLSEADPRVASVAALVRTGVLSGRYTTVELTHGETVHALRLRGPEVILVEADGGIDRVPVDWTLAEFKAIERAMACADEAHGRGGARCGAPFMELDALVASWPKNRVPGALATYLTRASR